MQEIFSSSYNKLLHITIIDFASEEHRTDLIYRGFASNGILCYSTIQVFPSSLTQ